MTLWRVASSSLLLIGLLASAGRAERPTLQVPAATTTPVFDGTLKDSAWKKGAHFRILRDKDVYGEAYLLRSGRQLLIGYRSPFKPLALGIRLHFTDPQTNRMVAVIVAPMEMPHAPLSAWLHRRRDEPVRLDASSAGLRFDFSPDEGFSFTLRLPLDLIEIGRPKKAFGFDLELWDTKARRPMAFYPFAAQGGGGNDKAILEPVGEWGADVPADTTPPARNSAVLLLEELAKPAPEGKGDAIAALMGHRDGKRFDAPLAKIEARLREQVAAYPNYVSLRANLMRALIGRNQPAQALEVLNSMRADFASLARDERQALGELQLMRDNGRYADALAWLIKHEPLLRNTAAFAREKTQLTALSEAWTVEQQYRQEEAQRDDLPRVRIETSQGAFVLELFEDDAPNTVANYLELVGRGFYNGTRFHWSVATASLFGGDPNSRDDDEFNDGFGGPGYLIEPEQSKRSNFPFTVAMVPQRRTEWTMGSNFCINISPASDRDGRTIVFGRVIEGVEVVRKLGYYDTLKTATVLRKRDHAYKVVKRP